jgi:hypothetical protein
MRYEINNYVECRLEEWADWYLRHGDLGLGYPKRTLEGRLMDEGGVLIKATLPPDLQCNAEAEEIEHFVVELRHQDARLATVLKEQYFGFGNAMSKAKRLKLSYANFRVQLDMAKHWMAGRLSASLPRG